MSNLTAARRLTARLFNTPAKIAAAKALILGHPAASLHFVEPREARRERMALAVIQISERGIPEFLRQRGWADTAANRALAADVLLALWDAPKPKPAQPSAAPSTERAATVKGKKMTDSEKMLSRLRRKWERELLRELLGPPGRPGR